MNVLSSLLSSSRPSSTPGWRINIRLAALMDSISAIAFGLGLRFLVDTVGKYDFKLTGTLVGLWEGVIMLHFLKKMPKSSDPYIGFGVRLFIDFLFTESVARLVLVLIWTALGMVLADIAPTLWEEVGLERTWRHLRRDMYTLSKMVPTVAFFPPPRTVRFSPSRQPSTITEAPTDVDVPTQGPSSVVVDDPSIITTEQTPVDPAVRETLRRRLPGHFSSGYSDLDTEIGSPRPRGRSDRTSRRLSVYPGELDTSSEISSSNDANEEEEEDLDEANRSSSSLSSATARGDPTSTSAVNFEEVPDMVTEGPLLVDVAAAAAVASKPEEGELTPKHTAPPFYMPPTPSDSAARVQRNRFIFEHKEDLKSVPPPEQLPQIPDFLEEASTEDWEKIQKEDYTDEKPPTPPAKDRPAAKVPTAVPVPVPAPVTPPKPTHAQAQGGAPPQDVDMSGWDTLGSQFLSGSAGGGNTNINTTNDDTYTQPPAYQSMIHGETNYDDIYDDPPPGASTSYNPTSFETMNLFGGDDDVDGGTNPWQPNAETEAEKRRKEEEDARLRDEQEKALQEADRLKEEEEKKKKKKEEEEALKKKKEAEKAERLKKEAADAAARRKKREEEEAAEKVRKEAAAAEEERKEGEEKRKKEEEKRKKEEEKRKKEEEKRKKEEEAEKKKKEEQVAERKRAAEEAQARREEAARKNKEQEEEKRLADEAERKRKEDERIKKEAEDRKKKEEDDKKKAEAEAESQRIAEEARLKAETERQREEGERQKATADAEEAARQQDAAEENIKAGAEAQRKKGEEEAAKPKVAPGVSNPDPVTTTTTQHSPENPLPHAPSPSDPPPANNVDGDNEDEDELEYVESPTNEPEAAPAPPTKAETVLSTASDPDQEVKTRVKKMLTIRAQMVEVEARIEALKTGGADDSSPEVVQLEKTYAKLQKQAAKRYEAGTSLATMQGFDTEGQIELQTLNPQLSERKIEEEIERLLSPTAKSLYFTITTNKKGKISGMQKAVVVQLLDEYNFASYSMESTSGKKLTMIDIPEEKFAIWLTDYRVRSTQPNLEKEATTSALWQ
ncbi:hypothetical protein CPB84DRAFT_1846057 [Gymnopilus junonius]|uniref:Uncharacterized protein n=1 Tax=Gymnopilus junonius TaxID=109634 RepID=A0A9P5NT59_GYMJU|nr:hypothetical protein CPB84DRAFT_1846057 [Gymnopilus junonius]